MRVDGGFGPRAWREPDDEEALLQARAQLALRQGAATPGAPEPAPAPPPEPAVVAPPAEPFWGAGTPVPPNALNDLPAPRRVLIDLDGEPLPGRGRAPGRRVLIPAADTAADAPAPPPAPPAPAPPYVGERPVDSTWLAQREAAFQAIRADYEAARASALSAPGSGTGWVDATWSGNGDGAPVPQGINGVLVELRDPNAQPQLVGYDEGGAQYALPPGRWVTFDETAFAEHYRATQAPTLAGTAALAQSYSTDAATIFTRHPELWALATSDHALNAGPAPAGRAMGDAGQLAMLDLTMADPQIAALIAAHGGSVPAATGGLAQEQVRLHGAERYEQMGRLANAMAWVRQQYGDAMAHAQANGGVGWEERPLWMNVSDDGGTTQRVPRLVYDESGNPLRGADGQPQQATERVFNPDVFTDWYIAQGGQQHQAFASFYGRSHTTWSPPDENGQSQTHTVFDNPNWSMGSYGGMAHNELVGINPNDPPRMHHGHAVGFDLDVGWATHASNIKQRRSWIEVVVPAVIVGVVAYASAGTLGNAAAAYFGGTATVAGAAASAAVVGASAAAASGVISGNLTLRGVLQGALSGALSAGLMTQFSGAVQGAGQAGQIALRATVQGGVQALMGGSFRDGALAGFASGLAQAASTDMQGAINRAVADGTLTASQAFAARGLARVLGAAINTLGNPDDPNFGFASALVGQLLPPPATPTVAGTVFDDDGNLMPGMVDPAAPWEDQVRSIQDQLVAQGMDPSGAQRVAQEYAQRVQGDAERAFLVAEPLPTLVAAGPGWSPEVRSARQVIDEIENRIASGSLTGPVELNRAIGDTYEGYLRLAAAATASSTPLSVDDDRALTRMVSLISDLGHLARDQGVTLSGDNQALVQQARAFEATRHFPDAWGAGVGGGAAIIAQRRTLGATRPTGTPGSAPSGDMERTPPNAGSDYRRGLARQEEAANTLAAAGYRVEHIGDVPRANGSRPDLLIEGRVFDVYSPLANTPAANIVQSMASKAGAGQADRIVLNLADNSVSRHELRAAFNATSTGVREVIVIGPDRVIYRLP